MFRIKSLKSKLLAVNIVSTGAALLAACAVLAIYDLHTFKREMVVRAQTFANIVAGNCTAALSFNDSNDATQTLASLRFEPHVMAAGIYDPTGKLLAGYVRDSKAVLTRSAEVQPGQYRFHNDALEVSCRVQLNGEVLGTAFIQSDLAPLHARMRGYFIIFAAVIAGAMAVALGLAGRLTRLIIGPIQHLSHTATDVSANRNYTVRAVKRTTDELGTLVDCFNSMLDQIQERDVQLTLHRDHLEDLVADRTKELSAAKDKAEEASRAKSNFLANMSHEIRTPMTAVLGYADLMLSPVQTMSDRFNCLQVIRRNARHLMDLINDILDISKIEAEKMMVENIPCDPARIAVEVVSMLRPRAAAKDISLAVEFCGAIPEEISSDPLRLKQVLMNLTGNAIKFTEKGEVRVKATLEQAPGASRMRFDIIDTGIGMTKEQEANLFQPFVQADESMTRKYGGTGLGLVISKRLAKYMRGDLAVKSEPGRGSTFTVWIGAGPLANTPMREGLTESMLSVGTQHSDVEQVTLRGRILLVEDGIDNQHLLTMHLTMAGAEVVLAENGRIGLQRLAEGRFDLILMDMQMPVMDGYAAASKARSLGYTLPIIALTAHAMNGDRAKCIQAGCTDYLTKPIDQDLLLRTVASYLEKSAQDALPSGSAPSPARVVIRDAAISPNDLAQAGAPDYAGSAPRAMVRGEQAIAGSADPAPIARGHPTPAPSRARDAMAVAMRQAVIGFVSRLPARVDTLLSLSAAGDWEELRRMTHQLKGAGTGYGFPAITEVAARAEATIKAGATLDAAKEQIDELVELIRRTSGYDRTKEKAAVQ